MNYILHTRGGGQLFTRFSVLIGPINHIKHLVSKERLPFSVAYLASLGLTLYFSLGVSSPLLSTTCLSTNTRVTQAHSYLGSLIGAIVQVRSCSCPSCLLVRLTTPSLLGHCPHLIRPRILSRGLPNPPFWRADGPPGCRQPASLLILARTSPLAATPAYFV